MNYCKTLVLASALILSVLSGSAVAQRRAIPAQGFEAPRGNPDTRPQRPRLRDGNGIEPRRPTVVPSVQPRVQPRVQPTPSQEPTPDPNQMIRDAERRRRMENPSGGAEVNQQEPNGTSIERDKDGTLHIRFLGL